ncbi:bifunctional glutamate N-acetyltransferase/amino-acid acetyltransferase ArgJ [Candidatus Magnetominusculus xianensis]|uniref:Arginine biosynthesis bifunctional protein ArgJ n=1 Tax=Candidatus Magnetominusculus xianensis TaxID=1748249 RepID=A0ABR5SCQ3_9BACT|nr:bifunctional glutamate N-acetyltransferase/amino-acid acetyltransferase ArgJ [Candidatus Magnetominusculus xianensis]KWT82074.1 ornithine acetyltransferase [Candidatus Magnetominusculus xianensis]MBF0404430.1 bifunctional glutamate N-acetyltransferase/amino-acid acetyltransferase ArgJ [Nitrospirota bacterium]
MSEIEYHVPEGFLFSTVEAAVKKPGRKDIAIIYSTVSAVASGVFTTNIAKAAPVLLDIEKIKGGKGRAIVANSGNANACTGARGLKDTQKMSYVASITLNCPDPEVFVASTGVIGTPLPIDRMFSKIRDAAETIGNSTLLDTARAIMTTDSFPKIASAQFNITGKTATVAAVAKGAGMICPNMATMLCFVLTDAAITKDALDQALICANDLTFNRITVDGDMSTNDTVLVLANGLAGNKPIHTGTKGFNIFKTVLTDVLMSLATMIVKDGEGATKVMKVLVKGTKTEHDASIFARAIANSLLVKTAVYGCDANWGRVIAAAGHAGVHFDPNAVDIFFGSVRVVKNGLTTNKDAEAAGQLKADTVTITINFRMGKASAQVLSCDLTEEYIKINAEYRT